MTRSLTAFEAIALVPGWDPDKADIEALKGGLTNRTYQVRIDGGDYVMRLESEQANLFGFDRSGEVAIMEAAGRAGLAPHIHFANPARGLLVTSFLPGRVWTEEDLESSRNLEALAGLLQRVHALPVGGGKLDIAGVARTYQKVLERRQGLHAFATRCVDVIESVPASDDSACCHNDIVAANVIDGQGLKLIDWEFACKHDPYFDLASAIGFHNLDAERAGVLLDAYVGGSDGAARDKLAAQVRIYDAIQWLWLAARHLVYPKRWQAQRLEELQQRIR